MMTPLGHTIAYQRALAQQRRVKERRTAATVAVQLRAIQHLELAAEAFRWLADRNAAAPADARRPRTVLAFPVHSIKRG